MLRRLHSIPGLVLAIVLSVTALSGAVLSLQPVIAHFEASSVPERTSVAALASEIIARHPGLSDLKLLDDGTVVASFDDPAGKSPLSKGKEAVDPATGASLGPYVRSAFFSWLIDLHRSFFAGDAGRMASGVGALAMVFLTVSGMFLLQRRAGGWLNLAKPIKGTLSQRLHGELGRLVAVALALSALTGLWMTASTFGLVTIDSPPLPSLNSSAGVARPVGSIKALADIDIGELRDLQFPASGDPTDVYTLSTTSGDALIDQTTGSVLAFQPLTLTAQIEQVIRMVHTGRGLWAVGLVLGLGSLAVPVFGVTGAFIFASRRTKQTRDEDNVALNQANLVILIGTEGGSTRGFARSLAAALTRVGFRVHIGDMNALSPAHLAAKAMFILTATYGDGQAPSSASRFLDRLARLDGRMPVAVLGFGDSTFPDFGGFANKVTQALADKGWPSFFAQGLIDRQSVAEFRAWGTDLSQRLQVDLALDHVPTRPSAQALTLIAREIYGAETDAPTAILRFALPKGKKPAFAAGDLLGVYPPGEATARYYSLASSRENGFLEICVRHFAGGLCSTHLHQLAIGDAIEGFVRENPSFRPHQGDAPLILIGAGAGIGPLHGFIRANKPGRPVHLYWGGRNPTTDFLYHDELVDHIAAHRLTRVRTAFSRVAENRAYVQDRIHGDAEHLRQLIGNGAQILVCGGRDMAQGVQQALHHILRPLGTSLSDLKSSGRYVEDVY